MADKEIQVSAINTIDAEHKAAYDNLMHRMGADERDANRAAFAYLVTLDVVCRAHIRDLYDFEDGCIHSNALDAAWQTGTSLKTTRLAFNLFTDNTMWTDEPECLSPVDLFSCDYAQYYWQAKERKEMKKIHIIMMMYQLENLKLMSKFTPMPFSQASEESDRTAEYFYYDDSRRKQ